MPKYTADTLAERHSMHSPHDMGCTNVHYFRNLRLQQSRNYRIHLALVVGGPLSWQILRHRALIQANEPPHLESGGRNRQLFAHSLRSTHADCEKLRSVWITKQKLV